MTKLALKYNKERYSPADQKLIALAQQTAVHAHDGQRRASGEPFVAHPLAVAGLVAEWGMEADVIAAALLHDVVEDTQMTLDDVRGQFGDPVAALVDGVTKLRLSGSPRLAANSPRREASNENLRKLLLASTKDIRVLMLKLADRLHNMRTLEYLPLDKQALIARESLEVFAPLADRLGMGAVKAEMEDLGFKFAQPEEYEQLVRAVALPAEQAEADLARMKRAVSGQLRKAGVQVQSIEGRRKHYYSVYKKLQKVEGDISKIYDLVAVRVIVPDVAACYQTLGILHQNYRPLIYRIKDYIAVPKPNGYQSLHTTVFGLEGRITEIQIRTPQMHEAAEYGMAAHFFYDQQKSTKAYTARQGSAKLPRDLQWIEQLNNLQHATGTNQEFAERARLELFRDRIFVFSPKGDLYELPDGATPLDFAFAVHSQLGLRALGARVNSRMTGLDTRLENRDIVEIVTRREAAPSRDWLGFVVTSLAKNRIRSWFRAQSRDENIASGRAALEAALVSWGIKRIDDLPKRAVADAIDALHLRSMDDLLVALAEGALTPAQAIRRLVPDAARPADTPVVRRVEPTGKVLVNGKPLPYTLAPCCRPVFPQSLVGYITRGKGVTVHKLNCRNVPGETERLVSCKWETQGEAERVLCRIELIAANRVGVVSDITATIARRGYNLAGITSRPETKPDSDKVAIDLGVEVPDLFELASLLRMLAHIPGVESARRKG